jgi:hypothetical protein
MDFRTGTWARAILETQRPNGSWGQFHSRVAPYKDQTTEQALRRLHILGFTREDPPVRRALAYLRDCLQGRQTIPDRREKGAGWDCYVTLMLAAAIRIFDPSDPAIRRVVDQWRRVAAETFAAGTFDEIVYRRIFTDTFGISPCVHSRYADFSCRYPVELLAGVLDAATGAALVRHVLDHPSGLYYVCDGPIRTPPAFGTERRTSAWIGAIELLSLHPGEATGRELRFAEAWLEGIRDPAGEWDLGPAARDGIYLPLSDSWRSPDLRRADCTLRIGTLVEKLRAMSGDADPK